jgi:hypothetical protein
MQDAPEWNFNGGFFDRFVLDFSSNSNVKWPTVAALRADWNF